MLTKKKWYSLWEEYASLREKKRRDGIVFTKEKRLLEVREELRSGIRTLQNQSDAGLYQRITSLSNKLESGAVVLPEDFKNTFFYTPPLKQIRIFGLGIIAALLLCLFFRK